ncbi:pyridoxamine 5'-phosphate oxidase family protein [Aneurinibacillus sp. Ricciae_BoGa-3]|uniref:pyridoxamine 5'-phosphate oxidase family protein n=1 Tax=Aneurinibacillus sp. Ricciae_BoGa-3 TaxID=3022697 RepID=UPI0023400699|nr:pyridoxamine 5'-phosphate oxidase family protein [Aneurinibacillus sp. Ricciae_BoGa-3]WCK55735.1 pyridoxamine 5'-phosphate oxidase family protein [Aneurinibacillus sp. Ricciae_BoGa-3]
MANDKAAPNALTKEQSDLLNSETLILLSTVDAETNTPGINAISWVKAYSETKIRFSVTNSSRIVANIKANPGVTLAFIGLESVFSIVGKASILEDKMDGVSMPLAKIEVEITGIFDSMFWGAKIVQEPKFEKTYDLQKAKALDDSVFTALLK